VRRVIRPIATTVLTLSIVAADVAAQAQERLQLPMKEGSVRFLVIGDSGTGSSTQRKVAARIAEVHKIFPFEFAIMVGDNLYGGEGASDYRRKFEEPYKPLLDAGVKFYASLGNHDDPTQRFYKLFNMNGERYYSFKAPKPGIGTRGGVRFFALDSNYMSKEQLEWLEKELAASGSDWKVPFFHHPLYSSGEKHGADEALREQLEPLFLKHGVDVVFTGHEHFYERLKPQKGITYFVNGSAAKLRKGNIGDSGMTAKGFDTGYAFMIVEIAGDEMYFQTIEAGGKTIDSGVIKRREAMQTTKK
jgi:3',5'-cyclic AMP phosphodiesterase CpdA